MGLARELDTARTDRKNNRAGNTSREQRPGVAKQFLEMKDHASAELVIILRAGVQLGVDVVGFCAEGNA